MANGYDYSKEYGPHKYSDPGGTGDCDCGCGCHMEGYHSNGPIGLDPFGECPNNPKDKMQIGGNADCEIVVERRFRKLTSDLKDAEERAKKAEETSEKRVAVLLQQELDAALCNVSNLNRTITHTNANIISAIKKPTES